MAEDLQKEEITEDDIKDALLLGAKAFPDLIEGSLAHVCDILFEKLSTNKKGKTSLSYDIRVNLNIDLTKGKDIKVEANDNYPQPKESSRCHCGQILLGQILPGMKRVVEQGASPEGPELAEPPTGAGKKKTGKPAA